MTKADQGPCQITTAYPRVLSRQSVPSSGATGMGTWKVINFLAERRQTFG